MFQNLRTASSVPPAERSEGVLPVPGSERPGQGTPFAQPERDQGTVSPLALASPVIWRPIGVRSRLRVRLPHGSTNSQWIKDVLGGRTRPKWNAAGWWEIASPHLPVLVQATTDRFGFAHVCLDCSSVERCDRRCAEASSTRWLCECACGGTNHGVAADGALPAGWSAGRGDFLLRASRDRVVYLIQKGQIR